MIWRINPIFSSEGLVYLIEVLSPQRGWCNNYSRRTYLRFPQWKTYLGFPSMMWFWPLQWSQHEVPSRCLDDEALSPLVKSVCFFSFKVGLNFPVNVLTIWFPSALFEIIFAISNRSATHENIYFPVEVWVLLPGESWRRMLYPCICTILSLYYVSPQ